MQLDEIDRLSYERQSIPRELLEDTKELAVIVEEMEAMIERPPRGVRLRQLEPELRRCNFSKILGDETYRKMYRINYHQLVDLTKIAKPYLPVYDRPATRKYTDEELMLVTVQFLFQGMTWIQLETAFDVSATVAHDAFPDYAYALCMVCARITCARATQRLINLVGPLQPPRLPHARATDGRRNRRRDCEVVCWS